MRYLQLFDAPLPSQRVILGAVTIVVSLLLAGPGCSWSGRASSRTTMTTTSRTARRHRSDPATRRPAPRAPADALLY
ncbi:hypothetical protein G7085_14770 [Tessaracoccus sp. HDW20]|uniref:hypothetical protein n=1 Tax=Tessaracoccus coleopterorum TaxID=2714950 RepID=UPI0018D44108|nr:hypothetical protein [Tessaracoccus coleopterorum]NHB85452.1 hypothetical protein [Tessaracoccus coleopterorum]